MLSFLLKYFRAFAVIVAALAPNEMTRCVALFLNLPKAFDTVNHRFLLDELASQGFDDATFAWLRDYLFDRAQCIDATGMKSKNVAIENVVPQGLVLGPTVYIYTL